MDKTEYKYHLSKKTSGGTIYGVRADTEEEIMKDMADFEARVIPVIPQTKPAPPQPIVRVPVTPDQQQAPPVSQAPVAPPVASEAGQGMVCKTCSYPAELKQGVGKNNKPYKMIKCSAGDDSHTEWINDKK